MSTISPLREQLVEEILLIPDTKLAELLNFIHCFRLGLQVSQQTAANTVAQPAEEDAVLENLRRCVHQPRKTVALGNFRLNLDGFRFDREEANAR
ncbi:MAG: hypothetical protein PHE17_05560 [Thiothrix sp.]|uniref:hypothetical protein n=1 Tax=Thiothrix sp. TaxID=1032 RepID=UPI00261B52CF|nr:hypothetical protein [Thiothrix sp.]MDD5392465.1 hypothetical protein [Thiothrix sp.]